MSKSNRTRAAVQRAWIVDLRWGVWQSLVLTGICLSPAAFVFVVSLITGRLARGQSVQAGKVLVLYLALAIVGGVVLGVCRPMLRTRGGTLAVGAFVGAAMFVGLGISADAAEVGRARLLGIFVVLGAVVGALTAAYMRARWPAVVDRTG